MDAKKQTKPQSGKLWDKQPAEADLEYRYFLAYLLLGPTRTIATAHTLANCLGVIDASESQRTWDNLRTAKRWDARADAWDAEQRSGNRQMVHQLIRLGLAFAVLMKLEALLTPAKQV